MTYILVDAIVVVDRDEVVKTGMDVVGVTKYERQEKYF